MYLMRPLYHCPYVEEPSVPFGVLEADQAPTWAIELIDVLEQPLHSVEDPASDPKH